MNDTKSPLAGKRCLVTGGTGFIGGRLAERLVRECGADVRIVVRNLTKAARSARYPVDMAVGDVVDAAFVQEAAKGCDVLFHCAYGNSGTLDDMRRVNVDGMKNVLDAGAAQGARVVNVSTLSVYGATPDGDLDERAPRLAKDDVYAESKLEAENMALEAARSGKVAATVIEPTVVYGPYGPGWTLRILGEMKSGRVMLVNGGDGLCNAVYVDDLVSAMLSSAVRDEAVGEAFLVSGAAPVTWKAFYGEYERMLGRTCTATLSLEEAEGRWNGRGKRKSLVRESLAILREEAPLRGRFKRTTEVDALVRASKVLIPAGIRRSMKERLRGRSASAAQSGPKDDRPVHLLPPVALRFFASKTRVKIDKARERLGYRPLHDLAAGMAKTEAWARWANLLPGTGDGG